jgi:hypothetical protein
MSGKTELQSEASATEGLSSTEGASLSDLLHAERIIKKELHGYHIDIMLYPSGGLIDATGCSECGTDDRKSESVIWKAHRGETLVTAIEKLKVKLGM